MSPSPEVWSDLYGAAHLRLWGRPGGPAWLVACQPESGLLVAAQLEALMDGTRLKGQLELLVHLGLAPLAAAVREGRFAGVLLIGPLLCGGPATHEAPQTYQSSGGLRYQAFGALPAWASALEVGGAPGEHAAASLCASLGAAVIVCPVELLGELLLRWAGSVPHGLSP